MKRKILYTLGTIAAVVLVAFGYYAISPLFRNVKMDEPLPPESKNVEVQTQTISAQVIGTTAHPASGVVRVVEAGEKNYIRYENFKTINGPDIYVYLAKDLDAKDFVNLGKVKATEGNINYEIPEGLNVADYKYVLTWCKTFGVLFNYADLSEIQ